MFDFEISEGPEGVETHLTLENADLTFGYESLWESTAKFPAGEVLAFLLCKYPDALEEFLEEEADNLRKRLLKFLHHHYKEARSAEGKRRFSSRGRKTKIDYLTGETEQWWEED